MQYRHIVCKSTGRILAIETGFLVSYFGDVSHEAILYDKPMRNHVYSFANKRFTEIPPKPSKPSVFSYEQLKWIDNTNLEDSKKHKWQEIKKERKLFEFGGFEFKGRTYDSDQLSQSRIIGASLAGVDQVWTTADNTTVYLTGDELKELYTALQEHVAKAHERGRQARELIDKVATKEEVESITF